MLYPLEPVRFDVKRSALPGLVAALAECFARNPGVGVFLLDGSVQRDHAPEAEAPGSVVCRECGPLAHFFLVIW